MGEPITEADETKVEDEWTEIGEDWDQNGDDLELEEDDWEENDEYNDDNEDDDEFLEEKDGEDGNWGGWDEEADEEDFNDVEQWQKEENIFGNNPIETNTVETEVEDSISGTTEQATISDNTENWWDSEDDGSRLISVPVLFAFAVVIGLVYFWKKRSTPEPSMRVGYQPVPRAAKSHTR